MACPLDCLSDFPLEFEGSSGDAARENLALLVEELLEEFSILVVYILDTGLFETAVFFLSHLYCRRIEIADFVFLCHSLFLLLSCFVCPSLFCVCDSMFVHSEREEADDALVTAILGFEIGDERRLSLELDEIIET